MRILYNILNPTGIGADRWIYEGYKNAFAAAGHELYTVTEEDDFQAVAKRAKPDLFFLDFLPFMDYCRRVKDVSVEFLQSMRASGTKIFCEATIGADREQDTGEKVEFLKRYLPAVDICFSNFSPETMANFEKLYGKKTIFVPHAADTSRYFPEKPEARLACDIAFIGSFYTDKRPQFEKLLLPLMKKYRVRIYGSGWTFKSKLLRAVSGGARRFRMGWLAKLANKGRISVSIDDERKLYASAKVCVNIHEYYRDGTTKGFSNEREFKIPASGGFELSDYVPGMERYFDLGKEIVAVRSPEEWFARIAYYLDPTHDAERAKIQEAGMARVLREHTYSHRVKQLLGIHAALPK